MDIHGISVDMDMDMDGKFHIHGQPAYMGSRVGFDGGTGDVSWSLDFGIPPTGDESDVPRWDAFDPPRWSKLWG